MSRLSFSIDRSKMCGKILIKRDLSHKNTEEAYQAPTLPPYIPIYRYGKYLSRRPKLRLFVHTTLADLVSHNYFLSIYRQVSGTPMDRHLSHLGPDYFVEITWPAAHLHCHKTVPKHSPLLKHLDCPHHWFGYLDHRHKR